MACIGGLLAHLSAIEMLEFDESGVYDMKKFTTALAEPLMASTVDLYFDFHGPANLHLPGFVAKQDFETPQDEVNGNL